MSTSTELRVRDVLRPPDRVPVVAPTAFFKQALEEMSRHRLGIACLVDAEGRLAGIITDGDVRRMLLRDQKPFPALFVDDAAVHANPSPTTIGDEVPLGEAVGLMERLEVWDLPVVDADRRFLGILHLHPVVKALLARGAG